MITEFGFTENGGTWFAWRSFFNVMPALGIIILSANAWMKFDKGFFSFFFFLTLFVRIRQEIRI